jgi:hypothetical protein
VQPKFLKKDLQMIRRSLLTAAFILVGSAAMGNSAFAQVAGPSIDVNFTGTVQGICGFGAVTNGNLAAEGSGPIGAYQLSSAIPGGSAGQVTVNCNQPANLQVSNPIQTGGPGGNQAGAVVSSPNNGSVSTGVPVPSLPFGGSSGPLFLNPGSTPLTVNLGVVPSAGNPYLQPGNYTYKVTLTITN